MKKVCNTLYKDVETAYIEDIVKAISIQPEVISLFEIYAKTAPKDVTFFPSEHGVDKNASKVKDTKQKADGKKINNLLSTSGLEAQSANNENKKLAEDLNRSRSQSQSVAVDEPLT